MIGNYRINRSSICRFTLIFLLSVIGCNEDRVPVPKPELDKAPVISVKAVASGGSGQIQYPDASPSTCASPCKSSVTLPNENATADLVLVIYANNPGGVKDLSVVISQGGPVYTVSTSSAPDSSNLVPVMLSIMGTNNAGGIGGNPLLIHLNKVKTNATVVVEAGNYNGQRSLYSVTYYMKDHVTASLNVSKSTIYNDEQTKLTWATTNAESIAITPALPHPPLPQQVNGSALVGPFQPGTYMYTLTARDWLESATSSKTITVNERPYVGGDIAVTFKFTCKDPAHSTTAYVGIVGTCVSNCSSPNTLSKAAFTHDNTDPIQCSGGTGGVIQHSPSDLQSGTWKVTVNSNLPYENLQRSDDCQMEVKAGEHRSLLFDYVRNPQTLLWDMTCRTN